MQPEDWQAMQNRREFILGTGRRLLLGGLLAVGGFLAFRRRADGCTLDGRCGQCPVNQRCELPPAKLARGGSPDVR